MDCISAPAHEWFLPGLSIAPARDEAARLALFRALGEAGRLEAFLYDAGPDEADLRRAWETLVDGAGVYGLSLAEADRPAPALCAVVVLSGFTGRAAFFHFCLLPGFERRWLDMGRDVLSWLFESGRVTSLIGVTPDCYRHVLRGLRRFGFAPRFVAPEACFIRRRGRHAGGVVSLCTKTGFEESLR